MKREREEMSKDAKTMIRKICERECEWRENGENFITRLVIYPIGETWRIETLALKESSFAKGEWDIIKHASLQLRPESLKAITEMLNEIEKDNKKRS